MWCVKTATPHVLKAWELWTLLNFTFLRNFSIAEEKTATRQKWNWEVSSLGTEALEYSGSKDLNECDINLKKEKILGSGVSHNGRTHDSHIPRLSNNVEATAASRNRWHLPVRKGFTSLCKWQEAKRANTKKKKKEKTIPQLAQGNNHFAPFGKHKRWRRTSHTQEVSARRLIQKQSPKHSNVGHESCEIEGEPRQRGQKEICPTNLQSLILTQHSRACDDPCYSKHVLLGVTTGPLRFEGSHTVH